MKYTTILFILAFIIVSYAYVDVHEHGHRAIATSHGCTEWEVNNRVFSGNFVCFEYEDRSEEMVLQEKKLHGTHEVVGYHLFGLIFALFMLVYTCVVCYLIEGKEKKVDEE